VSFSVDEATGILTIIRDATGLAAQSGTELTFIVDNLMNPVQPGSMGPIGIQTQTSNGSPISTSANVSTAAITCAGKFSVPPEIQLSNDQPAAESVATVTFTLCNPLPVDGKLRLTLPVGFSLDNIALGSYTGIDGGLDATVNGQVITFTRDGAGNILPSGTSIVLVIEGVLNPSEPSTGTFSLQTEDASGIVLGSADKVPGANIGDKPGDKRGWVVILAAVLSAMVLLCCCFGLILLCRRKKEEEAPYDGVVLRFQVQGHTNVATEEFRQLATELSTQRAVAVETLLVSGGVDRRMLNSRGFGFDQPLVRDATSPDAHLNLRVVLVLQNLYELERIIHKIEQKHAGWKPEQGFGLCGSPGVRINMKTGELVHPAIEFKDHTANLLSQSQPAVVAVARVLAYLESYASQHRPEEPKNKNPVQQNEVESELDQV